MTQASRLAVVALLAMAFSALAVPARADHMNGRYEGTDVVEGAVLELTQSGQTLRGELSGSDTGTLQGQTDGGDYGYGTLSTPTLGEVRFESQWTPLGLHIWIADGAGTVETFWELAPDVALPPPPPVPRFYLVEAGQQVGPFALEEVLRRIEEGSLGRTDLVWTEGMEEWARADSVAELAEAFDDGLPPPPPGDEEEESGPPPLPPDDEAEEAAEEPDTGGSFFRPRD